jgi:hypothetical protein
MLAFLCSSCVASKGGTGAPDGGEPDGDQVPDLQIRLPAGIEPAAPPRLQDCPAGWTATSDRAEPTVGFCEPWPEGPLACSGATLQLPGSASCAPVGTTCSGDDWRDDAFPPGADVVHVRAGASGGGTGSRDRPAGSIARALALADDGAILALAPGTYAEPVWIDRAVLLWGTCAADTVIVPDPNGVVLTGEALGARDLTIRGSGGAGLWVQEAESTVELTSIFVDEAEYVGIAVSASDVVASDILVRGVTLANGIAAGIAVYDGATVSVQRASVESSGGAGITAGTGARLVAADLVVRDADPVGRGDGSLGTGIQVSQGASARLDRAVLFRNRYVGVVATDPADEPVPTLSATDLVIRSTLPEPSSGLRGDGMFVNYGADVQIERAQILDHSSAVGIHVVDSRAALQDVVVADTGMNAVVLIDGTDAELARVAILRSVSAGMFLQSAAAIAEDVIVRDVAARESLPQNLVGAGIDIEDSAFSGARLSVANSSVHGMVVGSGSDAELSHLEVVDTGQGFDEAHWYRGVTVEDGAVATIDHAHLEHNRLGALWVSGIGTSVVASNMLVRGSESDPQGRYGYGLVVSGGGAIDLSSSLFEENRYGGVVVHGDETFAGLRDVSIRRTRAAACDEDLCRNRGAGIGLVALDGGGIEATRFELSDNALAGAGLEDGSLDLTDGVVRGNPVGLSVQTPGYDLQRLLVGVAVEDNGVPIDTASDLALPDPGEVLPGAE